MLHITAIKPLFTGILTTGEKYEEDMRDNGIIVANKGDLKLYQIVIAVGPSVRDIKEGDKVMIDPSAYARRKYSKDSIQNDMNNNPVMEWHFPWVVVDDEKGNPQDCLLLNDRDIKFVFEGEEKKESLIMPNSKIILES